MATRPIHWWEFPEEKTEEGGVGYQYEPEHSHPSQQELSEAADAEKKAREGKTEGTKPKGVPAGQRHVYIVGASEYGGTTHACSKGPSSYGGMGYAELGMGTLLGGLPCGTPLSIEKVGSGGSVIAYKVDIGLGGIPIQGHARRIDLYYPLAKAIGLSGTGLVRISRRDGKAIIGPLAEETQKDQAIPAGINLPDLASWADGLKKFLEFITSGAGWTRVLKVAGGGILLLIALAELGKIGTGSSSNIKDTAQKVAIGSL